jgi:hypothetical protein
MFKGHIFHDALCILWETCPPLPELP